MYALVENDTINSVLQNINVILTTPKGSDLLRPEFGSDVWQLLDKPLNALTAGRIKAEVIEAVEKWEPRVKIKGIDVKKDHFDARAIVRLRLSIPEIEREVEVEVPTWR